MLWVVLGKFSHCLKQAIPVSLECCVTQTTVCRNHYQMSCPWDTRVATLWVLMLSVTSSVRLEVYQSITARCQFITFQYFCKIDPRTLFRHIYYFFVRIDINKLMSLRWYPNEFYQIQLVALSLQSKSFNGLRKAVRWGEKAENVISRCGSTERKKIFLPKIHCVQEGRGCGGHWW